MNLHTPDHITRRGLLKVGLKSGACLVLGTNTQEAIAKSLQFSYSPLSTKVIQTYEKIFHSKKFDMFFFTLDEQEIGHVQMPKNWKKMNNTQKEAWRNAIKQKLAIQYKIPDYTTISVRTPFSPLEDEDDNITLRDHITQNTEKQERIQVGHQKKTLIEYVTDEFTDVTGNSTIDILLRRYITGLIGGESSMRNDLKSRSGALGVFQLMPSIIRSEVANPRKYTEESVLHDVRKQCEIAKNLFRDDWRLVRRNTDIIATQYYQGNTEDALRYFIFPLLINSYNTGYPTIRESVKKFTIAFPDNKSLSQKYKKQLAGLDVYWSFTQSSMDDTSIPAYGKDAGRYFFKTAAMTEALKYPSSHKFR